MFIALIFITPQNTTIICKSCKRLIIEEIPQNESKCTNSKIISALICA